MIRGFLGFWGLGSAGNRWEFPKIGEPNIAP